MRPRIGSRVEFTIYIPFTAKVRENAKQNGIELEDKITKQGTVIDAYHKNILGARRRVYIVVADDGTKYELEAFYIDRYINDKEEENENIDRSEIKVW